MTIYGYDEVVGYFVQFAETRRARKEHACCFCSRPIEKGTVYHRVTQLLDGMFTTWKSHSPTGQCADYDYEETT